MTIETKYDIGNSLWFIDDNKIFNLPVEGIDVNYTKGERVVVRYVFFEREEYDTFTQWNKFKCHLKQEDKVYTSKQELIENL